MLGCWKADPDDRLSFPEIHSMLIKFLGAGDAVYGTIPNRVQSMSEPLRRQSARTLEGPSAESIQTISHYRHPGANSGHAIAPEGVTAKMNQLEVSYSELDDDDELYEAIHTPTDHYSLDADMLTRMIHPPLESSEVQAVLRRPSTYLVRRSRTDGLYTVSVRPADGSTPMSKKLKLAPLAAVMEEARQLAAKLGATTIRKPRYVNNS